MGKFSQYVSSGGARFLSTLGTSLPQAAGLCFFRPYDILSLGSVPAVINVAFERKGAMFFPTTTL